MKKNRRDFILLIAFLIAFALVQIFLTSSDGFEKEPYTVFSSKKDGISLFYESLEALGMQVGISNMPVHKTDKNHIQVLIEPSMSLFDEEAILQWIYDGGNFVLLLENAHLAKGLFDNEIADALINITQAVYYKPKSYGSGTISFLEAKGITNKGIYDDKANSYIIASVIEKIPHDQISFNEYYHGYGVKSTLWTDAPLWVKFFLAQLVLCAIFVVLYFGRRFGHPVPYVEEIEREENEYVNTVGTLYKKSNAQIQEIYIDEFIQKASKALKTEADITAIEKEWIEKGYKHAEYFEQLNTNKARQIAHINKLNKILERSDN